MNTNNIKSFAKQARLLLMEGVKQRLLYWGFDANGNSNENLETTTGGYIFRGQIFNDESVPPKWIKLKNRLTDKQTVQDTIEEAAYTWFNRLMAIKILEKRGYLQPTLEYVPDLKTPILVQNAKRGQHQLKQQKYIDLLQQYLLDDQEEQALGLLLTRLCNNHKLLHDVFGHIDDYTEILLPNNLLQRNGIIDLLNSDAIPDEDYKEVELIGWLYQFYISDKKDEVFKGFKANKKARPEDIPAATQIFTPKWIVKYMVENTVGKIYLDFDTTSSLKSEMKYLVENETDSKNEVDSTLKLQSLEELTLIDPAAGSGHILVTGFELLFKMYREQGYTAKNAVTSILKDNLFGLDIDDRAMQLARFAVLLKAAEFYPEILNATDSNPLLLPHIYSFPETHHFQLDEIQGFLTPKGVGFVAELKEALVLLNQGKNIGTALKITLSPDIYSFITTQCHNWNTKYHAGTLDLLQQDLWNNLKPFLEVLLVMTKKYTAVVANPPYLSQRKMNSDLKTYLALKYPETQSDLFAVFMEVLENMGLRNGRKGIINQHSWMFLSSYDKYRFRFLTTCSIGSLLHLGPRTFEELGGEVVQSVALVFTSINQNFEGNYYRLLFEKNNDSKEKSFLTKSNYYPDVKQNSFFRISKSPVSYWVSESFYQLFENEELLADVAYIKVGLDSGNNKVFLRFWHEISNSLFNDDANANQINDGKWFPYNKGGELRKWYGNKDYVIDWENEGIRVKASKNSNIRSKNLQLLPSLSWSLLAGKSFGVRYYKNGFLFDNNGRSIIFKNQIEQEKFLDYLNGFLNSKLSYHLLSALNPTLAFQIGDLNRLPFIYSETKLIDVRNYSNLNLVISKKDWDSRETSWDFEQSPLLNNSSSLKDAYQKWQDSVTKDFFQLHENEEELNYIFIAIYGLQEELTPEVALKEITILQEELNGKDLEQLETVFRAQGKESVALPIKKDEVISQFISYCIGIFMGRYRLDKPGLHIAHPNPTDEELVPYEVLFPGTNQSVVIDEDAIIPIMGNECAFPDDALVRIKNLVHNIWGEETLTENLNFINECLTIDLDKYLTEQFWKDHTSRYKKKPIYWMFSSNPKKPQTAAFKVLVYMHRMDKYTVQNIQRKYLHPHQEWIKSERDKLIENESNLSKNELKRLEKLRNWELECQDYNEVLKTLTLQEITFDLDDGVTVNYEKFDGAVANI